MKNKLKSDTSTKGRLNAGARSLWRANGLKENQFGKPIFAIANSFTQFVPGHVHLHSVGQYVKSLIEEKGYFAAEFNTIAIDDGIAMGHDGMLYSLPSREVIADSVEYMCNAHKVDALICISNCDKITPGMLMAAMRLNIPTIFVSGGPMEAGNFKGKKVDLVDAMVAGADENFNEEDLYELEKNACPSCGSCSGMFTANSMNCLTEALGLALPGNGTVLATHKNRKNLFKDAANKIVEITEDYYYEGNETVLPKSIASKSAFMNSMTLDIAMGGSTNTVLHLLAIANEASVDFSMKDIDNLSHKVPNICKVSPGSRYHMEDVSRAGGIMTILGELEKANLLDTTVSRVDFPTLGEAIESFDIRRDSAVEQAFENARSAPRNNENSEYTELDSDNVSGCIRDCENAYSKDGGLTVLYGNIAKKGCIIKTAAVDSEMLKFSGKAKVFNSQDEAVEAILSDKLQEGDVIVIRYEGPKGGPGMQEMLYPTSYLKSKNLHKSCALITDGRFSGGTSGLSIGHISPEAAAKGEIGLLKDNDIIEINIPERKINVILTDEELSDRKKVEEEKAEYAYKPTNRKRLVSKALKAYALLVSSADKGAIRLID